MRFWGGPVFLALLMAGEAPAQPHGIEVRQPNTDLVIRELPPSQFGAMQIVEVFPRLRSTLTQSLLLIELVEPGNASNRRMVHMSQSGVIRMFPHIQDPGPSDVSVFLDIQSKVLSGGEQGLLGMAFDPDFFDNGEFYLYYTARGDGRSVIARYTAPNPASGPADAGSEEILLQVAQPFANHNAGMIEFGPDDMLYVALGDGGSGGDPMNNGQDTTTLLGSLLRIDVRGQPDAGLNYRIPPDNPFFNGGPAGAATRKEIYAYGLRNPYRFSFDKVYGHLFLGDVGQGAIEEVDVIVRGGNYGWRRMEGTRCFNPSSNCFQAGMILPIAEYNHSLGVAVIGGYVYYGSQVPELYGTYLFGDYGSGRIWGLKYNGQFVTSPMTQLIDTNLSLSSFGQDASGEVYLLNLGGGIYVLRPQVAAPGSSFPTRLTSLSALLSAGSGEGHTVNGVIPFQPAGKFWSDGADGERYFALPDYDFAAPDYAQMAYQSFDGWDFPDDTVLVKNLLLSFDQRDPIGSQRRVETQVLYKNQGQWYGFSYEWNDDQTDAVYLPVGKQKNFTITDPGGQTFNLPWNFMDNNQCRECHATAAREVLGLTTPQMNHGFQYPASGVTDNQIRTLDFLRYFNPAPPGAPNTLPRMPNPFDTQASLRDRARAYLAANCSSCHRPGGLAGTPMDLRWQVSDSEMNAINEVPTAGNLGVPGALIIKPGVPAESVLFLRMNPVNAADRMPPVATELPHLQAVALIRDWILSLGGAPAVSINDVTLAEGNAGNTNFVFTVSLSAASNRTVSVTYQTADGTAVAGADYAAVPPAVLTFNAGEVSKTVSVAVIGDTVVEPDETFGVNLSNPTNAGIVKAQGLGTITNDDVAAPTLSINDVRAAEGNAGTSNATFTVTLSAASNQPVTVTYQTADGTALAGKDYQAVPLTTLTFAAGETAKPVNVAVIGDMVVEPDETFFVNLANPTNATIARPQGVATITNDDAQGAPPAPILVAPSGVTSNPRPDFVWNGAGNATEYYLWINGPSGNVFNKWYQAGAVCNAGVCTVGPSNEPSLPMLRQGAHVFWVQARNASGTSPWSAAGPFSVSNFANPPGAPTLIAPTGLSSNNTPTYRWSALDDATDYFLWVNGPAGNVFRHWYQASSICSSGTCSVGPSTVPAPPSLSMEGTHVFWVRAANGAGAGPWSAGVTFIVSSLSPPGKATLRAPSGVISSTSPTYSFQEVAQASDYYLWINGPSGNVFRKWYRAADLCSSGICSVGPSIDASLPSLGEGSHAFWIQARNSAGTGPWSNGMIFQVSRFASPPAATTLIGPSGSISGNNPVYTWNAVAEATEYYLWVNGPSGNVFQRIYPRSVCSATCSVSRASDPSIPAPAPGGYIWWVQSRNAAGNGPWSASLQFVVSASSALKVMPPGEFMTRDDAHHGYRPPSRQPMGNGGHRVDVVGIQTATHPSDPAPAPGYPRDREDRGEVRMANRWLASPKGVVDRS